jgi:hypothetical protein
MAIQRKFSSTLLALCFGLGALGTAHATGSSAGNGSSASAVVGFRVVVREVLRFDQQIQRAPATAPQLTRTVTTIDDLRLVTVARP